MGRLLLVRHGQASFGAADYDRLSDLGHRQCVRLGQYLRERGARFEAVVTGTLKRHTQSWQGIAEGLHLPHDTWQDALPWPGLNEYDSEAVIAYFGDGASAPLPAELSERSFTWTGGGQGPVPPVEG